MSTIPPQTTISEVTPAAAAAAAAAPVAPAEVETEAPATVAVAAAVPGTKADPISHSRKAGLFFPVGRIHRYLKASHDGPVSKDAAVYVAGALEYLTNEVLELAGHEAHGLKRKTITERSISLAFQKDEDLNKVLGHKTTIAGGGVLPDPRFLRKSKKITKKHSSA